MLRQWKRRREDLIKCGAQPKSVNKKGSCDLPVGV